ncbi:hypothetical protein Taro_027712 [Colocasia esculenta]|uniref:Myb/SANT-like DNA-binding domain-containing protein n=1 Tax=Colocasia esculenta TaxID=4460 RepID=A0A843V9E8_COLES|nr:hypothetical protein [Colocasia esculenta]
MDKKEGAGMVLSQPPNPAMPYREDCWSEGATSTLIDAWGDRFLELNRGNLRQKHWQEVADAVNSRRTAVRRPSRTDVQCKNRIDTLKKKYKAEKARVVNSGGSLASRWAFYDRLDSLIGSSASSSKKPSPPPPLALPPPRRKSSPLPPPAAAARPASTTREKRHLSEETPFLQTKYSAATAAAAAAAAAARRDEEADSESSRSHTERSTREGQRRDGNGAVGGNIGDDAEAVRDLARAILRFGEIYERVEVEKQQQMIELEKQKMEFSKGLEFQRMQIFIDSMLQLQKIKRAKRNNSGAFEH